MPIALGLFGNPQILNAAPSGGKTASDDANCAVSCETLPPAIRSAPHAANLEVLNPDLESANHCATFGGPFCSSPSSSDSAHVTCHVALRRYS